MILVKIGVICTIFSEETDELLINVITAKGKDSLKNASIERADKLFSKLDFSKTLFVPASCKRDYTHKKISNLPKD